MRELREAKETANGKRIPQEQPPTLYPDLYWIWGAYCFLTERRGAGPNGPLPITVEAIEAYLRMSDRYEYPYVDQMLKFIPVLDREYISTFYENQRKETEKAKRKAGSGISRRPSGVGSGR